MSARRSTPASVGSAMGLYIAGSAIGGMAGRLGVSLLTDTAGLALGDRGGGRGWAGDGRGVPPARARLAAFRSVGARPRAQVARGLLALFRDRAMPLLFAEAFVLMGVFVSIYNYAGFRLMARALWPGPCRGRRDLPALPARLGEFGLVRRARRADRAAARVLGAGHAADRRRRADRGAAAGAGHRGDRRRRRSASSARIRSPAPGSGDARWRRRGQAAALYLFFYYAGSSVLGSLGGVAWTQCGLAGRGVVLRRARRRRAGVRAGAAHGAAAARKRGTPPRPLGTD